MNNLFTTNPRAIREVLDQVNVDRLSQNAKDFLNDLYAMAEKVDPKCDKGHVTMEICDLQSYKAHTLWSGKEDVEFLLDSGSFETYNFSDAELSVLAERVAEEVNWDGDCFSDCSSGNDEIEDVLQEVSSKMIASRPFSFAEEPWPEQPLTFWSSDMTVTQHLLEKLCSVLSPEAISSFSLRNSYSEGFFTHYDPVKQTIELYGSYWYGGAPGKSSGNIRLPLSEEETQLLIANYETACRRLNDGRDCLTILNLERAEEGLPPLKRPLATAIQAAQSRKGGSDELSPQTTDHTR